MKSVLFSGSEVSGFSGNVGVLALRLFVGVSLAFSHGIGKVPPSQEFIAMTGGLTTMFALYPVLFAWMSGLAELVGGVCIALGLCTRMAALFVSINMAVAGFIFHADDPFQKKEFAFLYLASAVCIMLIGCGKFGFDNLVKKRS
ncbi:MAG: DoxX family protein [Deltaproteobacteria bacterium]|nr:DoxX family protein [Deltaproteobacteria bacterium]